MVDLLFVQPLNLPLFLRFDLLRRTKTKTKHEKNPNANDGIAAA
jgi:hypothetical protein